MDAPHPVPAAQERCGSPAVHGTPHHRPRRARPCCGATAISTRSCAPPFPQPGEKPWKFWEAWSLFGFDAFPPTTIHWRFVPKQAGKILALYFVVAFGSSMDVAAIQADVATPLDYNKELVTVGETEAGSSLSVCW